MNLNITKAETEYLIKLLKTQITKEAETLLRKLEASAAKNKDKATPAP